MDDLEGAGIGVVDAPLFGRERVFEGLDLDSVIGERPGLVEAEGLEVALATTSIAATPPASMAVTNSTRVSNGVSPAAQSPSLPA